MELKLLVFWKTGGWGEVVAYKRWSQPEAAVLNYLENCDRLTKESRTKISRNEVNCTDSLIEENA